jgi:arsenite methyltransferase
VTDFGDPRTVARLGALYESADIQRQRRAVRDILALRPGARGLDIGCGAGHLACELAEVVGPDGHVIAMDPSSQMVQATAARADNLGVPVETRVGDAGALPVDTASLDFVTATQVLEYVHDVPAALAEIRRVLKDRGRVAIVDTEWRSCIWEASDRELVDRVLDAWRDHFVHPDLPRRLAALLRASGFADVTVDAVPVVNVDATEAAFSVGILPIITHFVRDHPDVSPDEAERFADAVLAGGVDGYFFSVCRYLFGATTRTISGEGDR